MNGSRYAPVSDGDKLRQRDRELSILNAIAKELNAQLRLDRALQVALAQVAQLLNMQAGWVWLLREDTGEPYLAALLDLPPALADSPEHMEGTCYCLDTFERRFGWRSQRQRGHVQPAQEFGRQHRRPALSRQHSALRGRQAARRAQCRQHRLARAVARGYAAALHRGRLARYRG